MSLGLLAKDSIANLKDFARDAENRETSSQSPNSSVSSLPSLGSLGEVSKGTEPKETETKGTESIVHNVIDSILSSEVDLTEGESSSKHEAPANPQQPQEGAEQELGSNRVDIEGARQENKIDRDLAPSVGSVMTMPTGQYSGFQTNYSGYPQYHDAQLDSYYHHDTYAPDFLGEKKKEPACFLHCLFPWFNTMSQKNLTDEVGAALEEHAYSTMVDGIQRSKSREDDESSNGSKSSKNSDVLGKRLSDRERQAVLARLRLAQPEAKVDTETPTKADAKKKGLLDGIPDYSAESGEPKIKPLKGILKRRSAVNVPSLQNSNSSSNSVNETGGPRRRSLFPSYDSNVGKGKSHETLSFAPMARVVTVKSKNDMSDQDKGDVWWQRPDYDEFRKTGRIITKAMLQGGSEIWLASTKSSNAKASAESDKKESGNKRSVLDTISVTGDKWWHKFGHSRRGLEHVVSMDEGRERQQNVRHAIRSVLEEQNRQKMYKREDAEKLRVVSLNFTSWARDLALAAGHSDADAVVCDFDKDRKSREFYLIKIARANPTPNKTRQVPEFMQPSMHTGARLPQARTLDAHTSTQLRYRRQQSKSDQKEQTPELSEPLRDPDPEEKKDENMAHRAAGFSAPGERMDMSAVLSGMGAMPQEPASIEAK
jgi:hypothetical protein